MRKVTVLFLSLGIIFSSLNQAESKLREETNIKKFNSSSSNEIPNILRKIENLFKRILRINPEPPICLTANVENLMLNRIEVVASCPIRGNSCSKNTQLIIVNTGARDPENDVLVYDYTVTGGKIVGKGANVVWDLSEAKPGAYLITAAVDDGCGFCGQTRTKEVRVVECPDCR